MGIEDEDTARQTFDGFGQWTADDAGTEGAVVDLKVGKGSQRTEID